MPKLILCTIVQYNILEFIKIKLQLLPLPKYFIHTYGHLDKQYQMVAILEENKIKWHYSMLSFKSYSSNFMIIGDFMEDQNFATIW